MTVLMIFLLKSKMSTLLVNKHIGPDCIRNQLYTLSIRPLCILFNKSLRLAPRCVF